MIEPNTKRFSNDLDYFQDSERRVASAFVADRDLLEREGFVLEVGLQQPGFVRAVVERDGESTKVEWAHDSSFRFMPTVADERFGFLLHPVSLKGQEDLVEIRPVNDP